MANLPDSAPGMNPTLHGMKLNSTVHNTRLPLLGLISFLFVMGCIPEAKAQPKPPDGVLLSRQGPVEFAAATRTNWMAPTNAQQLVAQDRLRTLALGQAAVQMQDL